MKYSIVCQKRLDKCLKQGNTILIRVEGLLLENLPCGGEVLE
jgi:hypothetical protein